ncbi:MAG: hypothetical protein ACOC0Q_08945 [Wenzhouxiangella sp.]
MPARLLKLASPKAVYTGLTTIALLLGALGWAGWQLFDAYKQIGSGEVSLAQCLADNAHQTRQLHETRDELAEMVAAIAMDRQAINDRLLSSERRDHQRQISSEAERRAREEIYSQVPECDEWRQQAACTEIAQRLIDRRKDLIQRHEGKNP